MSALSVYDLTIPCERFSQDTIQVFFEEHCNRWVFQKEEGESGYIHFQCRVSFKIRRRVETAIKFINQKLSGAHISPTANPTVMSGNEFYVTKEETRIDGPWSDKPCSGLARSIPKRLQGDPVWHPWQKIVLNLLEPEPDDRFINVIIDPVGGNGKTFLTMWLAVRGLASRIPKQKDARDIMRIVMDKPITKTYFFDFPRATSMNDRHAVFDAIEEIKNGFCYDDRYKYKELYFEPPHIWVFTNNPPDTAMLSRDRWIFHTLGNLNKFNLPTPPGV